MVDMVVNGQTLAVASPHLGRVVHVTRSGVCRLEISAPLNTWHLSSLQCASVSVLAHRHSRPSLIYSYSLSSWPTLITLGTLGMSLDYRPNKRDANDIAYSPWVILSDFGSAFAMGAVGGTIWHGIKGARNSPRVCVYDHALQRHLIDYVLLLG